MSLKITVKILSSIIHWNSFPRKHIIWSTKSNWKACFEVMWQILSESYRTSGCAMCQRACSTCWVQTSLQWARPGSAASAPIWTRPRTLPWEGAWCCHVKTEILNHTAKNFKVFFHCAPPTFHYLHDYKLEHEVQFTDVSWREVEQERRIPRRTGSSFGFSAANHSPFVMQSDQHLEFWRWTSFKMCDIKIIKIKVGVCLLFSAPLPSFSLF